MNPEANEDKNKIKKCLLLKQSTKKMILSQWDDFSQTKKENVINIVNQLNELEKSFVDKCVENDPKFKDQYSILIQNQKIKIVKKEEKKDTESEYADIENLLYQI